MSGGPEQDANVLLAELTARGVRLCLADNRVRFEAAPGAMSVDLLRALKRAEGEIAAAAVDVDPSAGEPLLGVVVAAGGR